MPAGEISVHIAQARIAPDNTGTTLEIDIGGSDNSIFEGRDVKDGTFTFGGTGYNIYQLGVQTLPGVKIQLGESSGSSSTSGTSGSSGAVVVGQTGIFELNLNGMVPITTEVTLTNLGDILTTNSGDNVGYCIIDVIYQKTDGEGVSS